MKLMRLASIVVFVFAAGGALAAEPERLDFSVWQRLPVIEGGRRMPLDTYARGLVEAVSGRQNPKLWLPTDAKNAAGADADELFPNGKPRRFGASELLFRWLMEPEAWQRVPLLVADQKQLRQEVFDLPGWDDNGRLRYVSPAEARQCAKLSERLEELAQRRQAKGQQWRAVGFDHALEKLEEAYLRFDAFTTDPRTADRPSVNFQKRCQSAADALDQMGQTLGRQRRLTKEDQTAALLLEAGTQIEPLLEPSGAFSWQETERRLSALHKACEALRTHTAQGELARLAILATTAEQQAHEAHLALYDTPMSLRLVPALSPAALEPDRDPSDDAQPWLGLGAMLYGSDELLAAYPRPELDRVRKCWEHLRQVYLDRKNPARSAEFAVAMDAFGNAVGELGRAINARRDQLPLRQRDPAILAETAYPPPRFTETEIVYNQLSPFFWSLVVGLLCVVCLSMSFGMLRRPMFWIGLGVLTAAQAIALLGFGLRWAITGLVPLTNMFETVAFVGVCVPLLGLWFTLLPLFGALLAQPDGSRAVDKAIERRVFALVGAAVGALAMSVAYFAPDTVMTETITNTQPILRDNFWLFVHVLTIAASYAAGALGWGLSNIAMAYFLFGRYREPGETLEAKGPPARRLAPEAIHDLSQYTYNAMQVAVLLLAAGTVFGALWADKAWGHFWSWDAKEVWSLVSLLVYMLILHARYAGWLGDFGLALGAVLGATCIIIAWYGVNFWLPAGKHSYGTGAGGEWEVGSAVVLNWLFVVAAAVRYKLETSE